MLLSRVETLGEGSRWNRGRFEGLGSILEVSQGFGLVSEFGSSTAEMWS